MRVTETKTLNFKPVHPKAIRHHGLFGKAFVRQHMLVDERWSPDALTQQFSRMSALLEKHHQFNRSEKQVRKRDLTKTCRKLQKQCRDGRSIIKSLKAGCPQKVRYILRDHRQMQRLYQKLPLHLAEENINQRTFVMRKERDRLQARLTHLEHIFGEKLLIKGNLENRLKFENEFKLKEEEKIVELMRETENSKLRLKANMTINSTYKKITHILQHDETFYLPILRSLQQDVDDQSQFISHILHLGAPAITRFQELSEQYRILEQNHRKISRQSVQQISTYQNALLNFQPKESRYPQQRVNFVRVRRYVRETKSMLQLKARYEEIENTIKKIKMATVCSDEKQIYTRIKSQIKNNLNLGTKIENSMMGHRVLDTKMKFASTLQDVLVNNFTKEEMLRLEKINQLKEDIKQEDEIQKNLLNHVKNVANIFVLLRLCLWNLHEIMRHVGPIKITRPEYPVEHLKLPLLRYEMMPMQACPPDAFEQNIIKLLKEVISKLKRLTQNFDWSLDKNSLSNARNEFCREMIGMSHRDSVSGQESRYRIDMVPELDLIDEVRLFKTVPSRNQIKVSSARFVEKCIKRDE